MPTACGHWTRASTSTPSATALRRFPSSARAARMPGRSVPCLPGDAFAGWSRPAARSSRCRPSIPGARKIRGRHSSVSSKPWFAGQDRTDNGVPWCRRWRHGRSARLLPRPPCTRRGHGMGIIITAAASVSRDSRDPSRPSACCRSTDSSERRGPPLVNRRRREHSPPIGRAATARGRAR